MAQILTEIAQSSLHKEVWTGSLKRYPGTHWNTGPNSGEFTYGDLLWYNPDTTNCQGPQASPRADSRGEPSGIVTKLVPEVQDRSMLGG